MVCFHLKISMPKIELFIFPSNPFSTTLLLQCHQYLPNCQVHNFGIMVGSSWEKKKHTHTPLSNSIFRLFITISSIGSLMPRLSLVSSLLKPLSTSWLSYTGYLNFGLFVLSPLLPPCLSKTQRCQCSQFYHQSCNTWRFFLKPQLLEPCD